MNMVLNILILQKARLFLYIRECAAWKELLNYFVNDGGGCKVKDDIPVTT